MFKNKDPTTQKLQQINDFSFWVCVLVLVGELNFFTILTLSFCFINNLNTFLNNILIPAQNLIHFYFF